MQLHKNEKIVRLVERLFGYHTSLKKRQLELISDLSEKHDCTQLQSYSDFDCIQKIAEEIAYNTRKIFYIQCTLWEIFYLANDKNENAENFKDNLMHFKFAIFSSFDMISSKKLYYHNNIQHTNAMIFDNVCVECGLYGSFK